MKKNPSLRLAINSFLVAVLLNTAVVSAHILTATEPHLLVTTDFTFTESAYIVALTAGLGVAIFAITCTVFYILTLSFAKMKKDRLFWLLMIAGIFVSIIADSFINIPLAKYNDQTSWIAAIAAFSIMVSLSSQYQMLAGDTEEENNAVAYN